MDGHLRSVAPTFVVFDKVEFQRFLNEVAENDTTKYQYLKNILALGELAEKFQAEKGKYYKNG